MWVLVMFSKTVEKYCVKERLERENSTCFVQHCGAIWATAELLLYFHPSTAAIVGLFRLLQFNTTCVHEPRYRRPLFCRGSWSCRRSRCWWKASWSEWSRQTGWGDSNCRRTPVDLALSFSPLLQPQCSDNDNRRQNVYVACLEGGSIRPS